MEICKIVDFQAGMHIIKANRRKTPGSLKRKVINGDSTGNRFCLFFRFAFLYPLSSYIHFNAKIPGCPAWNFCVRKNNTEKEAAVITSYDSSFHLVMIYFMHKNLNTATIGRNPDTHPSTCSSLSVLPSSSANIFA